MATNSSKDKTFSRQAGATKNPYVTTETILKERIVRDIGYGIVTPRTAHENYVDKKCPFTGETIVRGRILKGTVKKMKAEKTIVVTCSYLFYVPKYKRFRRKHSNFNAHLSPCWNGIVQVGDIVTCGETRPLSKTKHFAVVGIAKKAKDVKVDGFSI